MNMPVSPPPTAPVPLKDSLLTTTLTKPHTPERFRELFRLFRGQKKPERSINLIQSEEQIVKYILDVISLHFIYDHRKPLVAYIVRRSDAQNMPILMHAKDNKNIAEYALYRWFDDAVRGGDVIDIKTNQEEMFAVYIQKVIDAFVKEGGVAIHRDDAVGDALVRLKKEFTQLTVESILTAARRVGIVFGLTEESENTQLIEIIQRERKRFDDNAVIDAAVAAICKEVYTQTKPPWYRFWKRHPHEFDQICAMTQTLRMDVIVLADSKFPLDRPLNAANVRALLRNALRSSIANVNRNRIVPSSAIEEPAKRALGRRIRNAIGLSEPTPP
jgi:hypothetical protein